MVKNIGWNLSKKVAEDTRTLKGTLLTDHSYEGTIIEKPVGESVSFGQPLYFNWTDKEYKIALSISSGSMHCSGIALETKADGETCKILKDGWIRDDTWNFAGHRVYISTAGAFTSTAPTTSGSQVQVAAEALTADTMYFKGDTTLVEVA